MNIKEIKEYFISKKKDLEEKNQNNEKVKFIFLEEFFILKAAINQKKDICGNLLTQEKMGFKILKTWFLFPEEAFELFCLNKIQIFKFENVITKEILNIDPQLIEINDPISEFYKKNKKKNYINMDVALAFGFLRRKGLFIKRLSENFEKKQISYFLEENLKQKKIEENNDNEILDKELIEDSIFFVYKSKQRKNENKADIILIIRNMIDLLDNELDKIVKLEKTYNIPIKFILIENGEALIIDACTGLEAK